MMIILWLGLTSLFSSSLASRRLISPFLHSNPAHSPNPRRLFLRQPPPHLPVSVKNGSIQSELLNACVSRGATSSLLLHFPCLVWFWLQKKKALPKPSTVKNTPTVDRITGQTIPKSFVFSRGKLGLPGDLELDLRKLMLPHTTLKLKVIGYLNLRFIWFLTLKNSFYNHLFDKVSNTWLLWLKWEKVIKAILSSNPIYLV